MRCPHSPSPPGGRKAIITEDGRPAFTGSNIAQFVLPTTGLSAGDAAQRQRSPDLPAERCRRARSPVADPHLPRRNWCPPSIPQGTPLYYLESAGLPARTRAIPGREGGPGQSGPRWAPRATFSRLRPPCQTGTLTRPHGGSLGRSGATLGIWGKGWPKLRQAHRYVIAYKPTGVLSAPRDRLGRPTLSSLGIPPTLNPAGRLDLDSEGLVTITDDGRLVHRLPHPRCHHPQVCLVMVPGKSSPEALE